MSCNIQKPGVIRSRAKPISAEAATGRGYLVTFAPLASNAIGRNASQVHSIPPFVDGSIRREPDLLHQNPGISCLCRGDRFAPRLRPSDVVVYLTKKGKFGQAVHANRLIAVLKVHIVLKSHEEAAEWYRQNKLPLPNNCMVRGNLATPLSMSHRIHGFDKELDDQRIFAKWDGAYQLRVRRYPVFAICDILHVDLSWKSKSIDEKTWIEVFDRIPGTLNPAALPLGQIKSLLKKLGIRARF